VIAAPSSAALRRSAWIAAIVLAVLLLLGIGALNTVAGRDLLLARIVAALPSDMSLRWDSAEGTAAGPLTLKGVHLTYHGHELRAAELTLDPALRPLVWGKLRLDALQLRDAQLAIAASTEPFRLPQWPDSLPAIEPPLPIRADKVEVDGLRVSYAGKPTVLIERLRGGLDVEAGRLHIDDLRADSDRGRVYLHGDYAPRDDYRMALKGWWQLPTGGGVGLAARGSLAAMQVEVRGTAPGPLQASLSLRGRDAPNWKLRANMDGLDPGVFTGRAGAPAWYAALSADGNAGRARIEGHARRGDFELRIAPSIVDIERQRLELRPLALELLGGKAALVGHFDFADARNASLQGKVSARGLRWGEDADAVVANGDFGLAGTLRRWAAVGKATLARDEQVARLDFDARGDQARMRLHSLRASMPGGRLDATGNVAWAPALAYDFDAKLAGFDPAYFAPGWPGAVNGSVRIEGARDEREGLVARVALRDLGGSLRKRTLAGSADVRIGGLDDPDAATSYEGKVDLKLGASRIAADGRIADTLSVKASFTPLDLADLLPDAHGVIEGRLQLHGARSAPDVDVDLTGTGLQYGGLQAEALLARGTLPWSAARNGSSGALHVEGSGLTLGLPFEQLRADLRGSWQRLAVFARAEGDASALDLQAELGRVGDAWQGTLSKLDIAPTRGAAWTLDAPSRMRWARGNTSVSPTCLRGTGGHRLCVDVDWPRRGVDIKGSGLSLALLQDYLPERTAGGRWQLHGDLALEAHVRPAANGKWRGVANIVSASGGLASLRRRARGQSPSPATDLMRYDALAIDADFDANGVRATLGAGFDGHGRFDATLATGWRPDSAVDGRIEIASDQVGWLELFSPDLVAPSGRLQANLQVAGTRAHPRLGGDARLSDFTSELPALGITLRDGELRLDAQPEGNARVTGRVRSGKGTLDVLGSLAWEPDARLKLRITGHDLLASDTPQLRAVVEPDLSVEYADGDAAIRVTGTVLVSEARLQLESLDQGASSSPDVVILDPVESDATAILPIDLDLELVAGDKVRLQGFGLDAQTRGRLHVRARPEREVLASGALDVEGSYLAYGQKLQVTRGNLRWSNSPISDPVLDVRAEREVGEVTAGIDVRGRASAPVATVWSNPATSQSEAIAYLALGRPLASASRDESLRVDAARSALSIGGSLLASQLGARLGLDDAGVSRSRALGGDVIGAGKYLSPRVYVGYGVSLLGSGHVLTLKYLLRKGFDIEIESSTMENRASVNWRLER
jgi:translocation and assembly module TamB